MKKGYSLFNLNGFIRSVRWQEVAFYRFCKNSKIIDTKVEISDVDNYIEGVMI